jgi:hypothetical protein
VVELFEFLHQVVAWSGWIELGKIVLGLIMIAGALVSLVVALRFGSWHERLVEMEAVACKGRDDAMFEMTAARQRLRSFKTRFEEKPVDGEDFQDTLKLLQQAGSVVSLVMAKERSILSWGLAGAKLANTAIKYWKSRGKS